MNEKLLDILKPQGQCISEEMLISYARGTLAAEEARRVEEHLTECEFCSDALDGIMKRDYPVIMGVVLFGAVVFVAMNLIVDLSYHFLDPRVRIKGGSQEP